MILEDRLRELVVRFKDNLDSKEKLLECFCKYGVQLEGWLKGELLCFLDNEKATRRLADLNREVSLGVGKKKVDLRIEIPTSSGALEAWIELKHWLIGYQKGSRYNAQFYFKDPSRVGIKTDVTKLSEISSGSKFILILSTANPGVDDWATGVDEFNRKFSPLHLKSLTNPAEFPSYYFLGLLKISS
jgi:hypothetical protein